MEHAGRYFQDRHARALPPADGLARHPMVQEIRGDHEGLTGDFAAVRRQEKANPLNEEESGSLALLAPMEEMKTPDRHVVPAGDGNRSVVCSLQ